MEMQFVIALILAIPVVLIPVAFIWYLNAGIFKALKNRKTTEHPTIEETTVEEKELAGTRR